MCLGVPARILELHGRGVATADLGGVRRVVSVAFVPDAAPGEWVLVHVGFALARIDEAEAEATLELLADALEAEPVA